MRAGLSFLVVLILVSCGGPPAEEAEPPAGRPAGPETEEVRTDSAEVPAPVRDRAEEIAALLGPHVRCEAWFWDREDGVWECALIGLDRTAELDIAPDAEFSELEYVFPLGDVELAVPYLDDMIEETCGQADDVVVELSIRVLELLATDPKLDDVWGREGVFIEVQCPDGVDFEVDPFGSVVTKPDDDIDTSE